MIRIAGGLVWRSQGTRGSGSDDRGQCWVRQTGKWTATICLEQAKDEGMKTGIVLEDSAFREIKCHSYNRWIVLTKEKCMLSQCT
jgi:hypothetical protein